LEVRQKYFNDSKKKYRNTTVSDPALRSATRVQGTKSVALRTKVGLDPNSSVEINRIVAAASKVRPRTAFGFEFRKYLGYEGGPDRTDALFMERLKTAINNGMLGLNWCANAQGSLLAQDWGREERRDMVR
jgi:hypothetical protein